MSGEHTDPLLPDTMQLAETYANFLRTKLTPHLESLVSERDALESARGDYELMMGDMLKLQASVERGAVNAVFPPRVGWSRDDLGGEEEEEEGDVAPVYLTPMPREAFEEGRGVEGTKVSVRGVGAEERVGKEGANGV